MLRLECGVFFSVPRGLRGDCLEESQCDSQAGGLRGGSPCGSGGGVWLAAYTRPRFEHKIRNYCEERGIEVFLPCRESLRRWSDRSKLIELPLFPSYLFVRPDIEERRRVLQAPGFLWFVRNQVGPIQVEVSELLAVRRLLASGLRFDPLPGAQVDDEVEVVAGPLRGFRGHLLRKHPGAIVILVSAVNGAIRISLPDASAVRPVGPRRPPAVPGVMAGPRRAVAAGAR